MKFQKIIIAMALASNFAIADTDGFKGEFNSASGAAYVDGGAEHLIITGYGGFRELDSLGSDNSSSDVTEVQVRFSARPDMSQPYTHYVVFSADDAIELDLDIHPNLKNAYLEFVACGWDRYGQKEICGEFLFEYYGEGPVISEPSNYKFVVNCTEHKSHITNRFREVQGKVSYVIFDESGELYSGTSGLANGAIVHGPHHVHSKEIDNCSP